MMRQLQAELYQLAHLPIMIAVQMALRHFLQEFTTTIII